MHAAARDPRLEHLDDVDIPVGKPGFQLRLGRIVRRGVVEPDQDHPAVTHAPVHIVGIERKTAVGDRCVEVHPDDFEARCRQLGSHAVVDLVVGIAGLTMPIDRTVVHDDAVRIDEASDAIDMPAGVIAGNRTVGPDDVRNTEPVLQIDFGCGLVGVAVTAVRVADDVPIQNHGIDTVELQIAALVNDIHVIDGHRDYGAHLDGNGVVIGIRKREAGFIERAPPGVELPVLDSHRTVLDHVNGTVVAHPGVLVRDVVPGDIGIVRVAARVGDRGARLVPDIVPVVENMHRLVLVLGDHYRDLSVGGFVGLLVLSGPLQPDGFLRLELRGNPADLGRRGGRHRR